eukprot:scaffold18711_cov119-Isochrysis_galbana.AAC.9
MLCAQSAERCALEAGVGAEGMQQLREQHARLGAAGVAPDARTRACAQSPSGELQPRATAGGAGFKGCRGPNGRMLALVAGRLCTCCRSECGSSVPKPGALANPTKWPGRDARADRPPCDLTGGRCGAWLCGALPSSFAVPGSSSAASRLRRAAARNGGPRTERCLRGSSSSNIEPVSSPAGRGGGTYGIHLK